MELFVLILLGGTFALGLNLGLSRGRLAAFREQKLGIDRRFAVGWNDAFRETYGLAGLYVADVNKELLRRPLVIIQGSDFLDLVARRIAGADATGAELARLRDKLTDDYLLNKGMSPSTLAAIKRV